MGEVKDDDGGFLDEPTPVVLDGQLKECPHLISGVDNEGHLLCRGCGKQLTLAEVQRALNILLTEEARKRTFERLEGAFADGLRQRFAEVHKRLDAQSTEISRLRARLDEVQANRPPARTRWWR